MLKPLVSRTLLLMSWKIRLQFDPTRCHIWWKKIGEDGRAILKGRNRCAHRPPISPTQRRLPIFAHLFRPYKVAHLFRLPISPMQNRPPHVARPKSPTISPARTKSRTKDRLPNVAYYCACSRLQILAHIYNLLFLACYSWSTGLALVGQLINGVASLTEQRLTLR